MAVLVSLLILFAMTGYSSAAYCVCKQGVSDPLLQKTMDFACGNGADCTQIQQNGACYQPNSLKSHCDYAVNSYYQRKSASGATCDFSGTASLTNAPPSAGGSCVFPSSPGTGTPTTGVPTTGTPTTPTVTPTTGTPTTTIPTPTTTVNPTTGTPTMGIPTTASPTTTTGTPSTVFPGTTMGPTGSGITDENSGTALSIRTATVVTLAFFSGLTMLWG